MAMVGYFVSYMQGEAMPDIAVDADVGIMAAESSEVGANGGSHTGTNAAGFHGLSLTAVLPLAPRFSCSAPQRVP
jgi:hypothetical protein